MRCSLCERRCTVPEGLRGACGNYSNREGIMEECFPGEYLVVTPVSIETVPLLHFHPGGKFLQITTRGCNFHCKGCISNILVSGFSPESKALEHLSPEEVVNRAREEGCLGVVFMMNDPLASYFSFLSVAREAKGRGLLVGCSTNGYFTPESLEPFLPLLDFVNLGIKGLSAEIYRECGGFSVMPALRNLDTLYRAGVHVEVSCMFHRKNEEELCRLGGFIRKISPAIPFQVMRYLPLGEAEPSLEPTQKEAENLCGELRESLDYVYLFNSPGTSWLHTRCPHCGTSVMERDFYGPMGSRLRKDTLVDRNLSRCSACGAPLIFRDAAAVDVDFREKDFQGGYPFTRALEMIEAVLLSCGASSLEEVVPVWEKMLENRNLTMLHESLQSPEEYLDLIDFLGKLGGLEAGARDLRSFMEEKLREVDRCLVNVKERPRVYYVMGSPLFHIKGGRLENNLVVRGGGESLNKRITARGRPGTNLTPEQINALNPEHIFISAFLSSPEEDLLEECRRQGIDVIATRKKQIHGYPAPGWDFGSPRWILGLLFIARILHPERCSWDFREEAREFYGRFYQSSWEPERINRSFARPHTEWRWKEGTKK